MAPPASELVAGRGAGRGAGHGAGRGADALWDVALPPPSACRGRLAMAGFAQRPGTGEVDLTPLPHPAVTLVVDLADESFAVRDRHGNQQGGSVVAGVLPGEVQALGTDVRCLQMRLDPPLAARVLGIPLGELDGMVVGLDDLWGPDARRLREQLQDAAEWDDRFSIAEATIRARLEHARRVDRELAFAWGRIRAAHGRLRVDELTVETGWSRQRLWSRFRAQLGLSPKRAAMLARFDLAAHRLADGTAPAEVAAEVGYADQSHLHREVRTFAGTTPSAVARSTWLSVDDRAWPTTSGETVRLGR